jgi:hypothetical protein
VIGRRRERRDEPRRTLRRGFRMAAVDASRQDNGLFTQLVSKCRVMSDSNEDPGFVSEEDRRAAAERRDLDRRDSDRRDSDRRDSDRRGTGNPIDWDGIEQRIVERRSDERRSSERRQEERRQRERRRIEDIIDKNWPAID